MKFKYLQTLSIIEGLCEWLAENAPLELTQEQIDDLIDLFARNNPDIPRADIVDLVDCLIEADLIVVEEESPCDECFARLPENVQEALTNVLETIPPQGLPQPTTPVVTIPTTVGTIEELCEFLENNILHVTPAQQQELISLFAQVEGSNIQIATDLINCLTVAGIVDVLTV